MMINNHTHCCTSCLDKISFAQSSRNITTIITHLIITFRFLGRCGVLTKQIVLAYFYSYSSLLLCGVNIYIYSFVGRYDTQEIIVMDNHSFLVCFYMLPKCSVVCEHKNFPIEIAKTEFLLNFLPVVSFLCQY